MKINTKLIMTASACLLGLIGLGLTFLPAETAACFDLNASNTMLLTMQLLGALYFAFAMLNWMAKGSVIGGIYNKPISIANLAHFLVGALALIKAVVKHPDLPAGIWILAVLYAVFSLLFWMISFQSPVKEQSLGAGHA